MNRVLTMLIAGAFATTLGACNNPEDPTETRADVAQARSEAAQDITEAQADMHQDLMQGREDVALAKAEGEHKVAIEQCEALPAEQQSACKDEADAAYEAARTAAETMPPS